MKKVLPSPILMLVTRPEPQLLEKVRAAVNGGVNFVQLRDTEAFSSLRGGAIATFRTALGDRAILVVNDGGASTPTGADGFHLREAAPRFERGDDQSANLIGRSVHDADAAMRAAEEGVDYIVCGTVFDSPSHPGVAPGGLALLASVCRSVEVPVVAIGGIDPSRVGQCMDAGARGVALISALMDSNDPARVAEALTRALGGEVSISSDANGKPVVGNTSVALTINGNEVQLREPMSIAAFLLMKGLHERIVVVEHNREIVPRSRYGEVVMISGDQVEIVQMMAGG